MELKPDLFEGNYYLGVFYTIKADEMNKVMNEKQYSSQTAYDTDLKEVNAVYMEAVPWFEKAYELKKDDVNTLDFLKSICFRLRDEEGMMDKVQQVQYPAQRKPKAKSNSCGGGAALRLGIPAPRFGAGIFMRRCACRDVRAVEFVG